MASPKSKPTASNPKATGTIKKLFYVAVALGGLLVIAGLLAPLFIDWNALKDKATSLVSEQLGRRLSIGDVKAGLFTGVEIHDITLANGAGFDRQPLFHADKAALRLSLFSIFSGKIIIKEIEFKGPKVLIEKNSEGKLNIPGSGSSESSTASSSKMGALPNVVLASLRISDAEIVYNDHAKGAKTAIKGLDLRVSGFSLKAAGKSRVELKFTAETEGKRIPVELKADFRLDLAKDSLALSSLKLTLPGLVSTAQGNVEALTGKPTINLETTLDIDLPKLIAVLPASATQGVKDAKASGSIALQAKVKGSSAALESMSIDATLSFKNAGVDLGDLPSVTAIQGDLRFTPKSFDIADLQLKLGGSPVKIKASGSGFTPKDLMAGKDMRMSVRYEITSPDLNLDPLLAIALAPDPPAVEAAKAAEVKRTGGIKDLRGVPRGLEVAGTIKAGALTVKKIKTGTLEHILNLRGGKLSSTMDLKLFDGIIWNKTDVDLTQAGPAFNYDLRVAKLNFDKAVSAVATSFPESVAVAQVKDKIFGALSVNAKGAGRGFKGEAIKKNLSLEGQFEMKDGKLKKLDSVERLAAAIPHPQTQAVLREDIDFGQMGSKLTLRQAKLTVTDFYLSTGADHRGGKLLMQGAGSLVLGGAVDFRMTPHFNPSVVKLDGVAAEGFNDDAQWATYNYLAYKGPTLAEAKADYLAGAKNAAKRVVDKKVQQVKQQAQEKAKEVIQEKGKDLIKQLPDNLKGLFGQ